MISFDNGKVSYTMDLNNQKKYLHLKACGFFSVEDGQSFLNDYNKIVKTFSTSSYNLIIDASDLKASGAGSAELLGKLLHRYIEVPFNKRYLVADNPVTKSQFRRLGEQVPGWDVESIESLSKVI